MISKAKLFEENQTLKIKYKEMQEELILKNNLLQDQHKDLTSKMERSHAFY